MKKIILKILTATLVCFAVSCKKSGTDNNTNPGNNNNNGQDTLDAKTKLLTQTVWKIKNEGIDTNSDGIVDESSAHFLQSCNADDMRTYTSQGFFYITEGATKCNATGPDRYDFTWTFASNETLLKTSDGSNTITWNIYELTDSTLKIYQEISDTKWEVEEDIH